MLEFNNGSKMVAKYLCLLKVQYFVQLHFSNIFCFCLPSKKRKSYNLHKDFNNVQYFRTTWNMREGLVHPSFDSLFGVYARMCRIHRRIWITNFIPIRTHGVYTQGKYFDFILMFYEYYLLRKKCSYSELFWTVFNPTAGKCRPEQLRIQTLFTRCWILLLSLLFFYLKLTNCKTGKMQLK